MPDFIDRLGAELVRVAGAEPAPAPFRRLTRRARWRGALRLRGLLIVPALAILGTGAAVASGILLIGAPTGPKVPPVATAGNGAATAASAKLLPLRVADPVGGLPWGLRSVRTTRGDVCLQVGRLADGTIGALGEDGSFGDDHRFHPFSVNYQNQLACTPLDAHGHGFNITDILGLPTSAMDGGGCLARLSRRNQMPCPGQETRDVYFGLLGPEAVSITYAAADGHTVTDPTVEPDGAYLIVTRALQAGQQGEESSFAGVSRTGPIRAVTYRDGHTCHPTAARPCAAVGFVAAKPPEVPAAALASPIQVRELPVTSSRFGPQRHFRIAYTAHVAVTSTDSFYYVSLFFPNVRTCHEYATGAPTSSNIRAGQRLVENETTLASCRGTVQGLVRYHPASAIHSPAPEPDRVDPGDIIVGRFSLRLR